MVQEKYDEARKLALDLETANRRLTESKGQLEEYMGELKASELSYRLLRKCDGYNLDLQPGIHAVYLYQSFVQADAGLFRGRGHGDFSRRRPYTPIPGRVSKRLAEALEKEEEGKGFEPNIGDP